ncbi:hypothetical protein C8J57DRAFT_1716366 [Mycena rebaudengoi]|nr:hypothetical protein C8J57DRAFT_1716366 [Mycena rebaudengoi]
MLNVRPTVTVESPSPILELPFDVTSEIFMDFHLDDEPFRTHPMVEFPSPILGSLFDITSEIYEPLPHPDPTVESPFPILRLPFDITSEIFINCLPGYMPFPRPDEAPIVLTRICQEWRAIALNTPRIWNVVHALSIVHHPRDPPPRLDREQPDELFIDFLNRHMGSCSDIELHIPLAQYQLLSAPDSLPLLQRLHFHSWEPRNDGPSPPSISVFEYAPRLHHVSMSGEFWPSTVALPYEQLTSFECYAVEIAQCLEVLQKGPNLGHCVLTADNRSPHTWSAPPHPCLRHLRTSVDVLRHISLPGLTELELQHAILELEFPLVTDFISRSRCKLKDISFRIHDRIDDHSRSAYLAIELLATLPSLTHLQFEATEAYTVTTVCERLHGNSAILPHLQILSLSCYNGRPQDLQLLFTPIADMLDARSLNDPSERLTSFTFSAGITSFAFYEGTIQESVYPSAVIQTRWNKLRGLGMSLDIRSLDPRLDLTLPRPEGPW